MNQPQRPRKSAVSATQVPHGKLRITMIIVGVVIVLSLLSAFIWPGWAIRSNTETTPTETASASATPTIKATVLPDDASELVSSLPDSVSKFARTDVTSSKAWKSADPNEEYEVTYSDGDKADNVTLLVAQWSNADDTTSSDGTTVPGSLSQYNALIKDVQGKKRASGTIKVDGESVGTYVYYVDDSTDTATAIWRNDTVVFEATGATSSVETLYQQFPM